MTIVKIAKREKDIVARTLAQLNVSVNFYTMENNSEMLQAEIDCNDPGAMYHIGRAISYAEENDRLFPYINF